MNNKVRELQSFFYSQNFYDGIRTTIGVLIPSLLMAYLGHLQWGIAMSLGAIGASLADAPGPVLHKRNGMLACIALCTVVAALTGFARMNAVTLGLEILVLSFLCSMLQVYGMRASLIGLAALLVMILTMDHEMTPVQIVMYSGLVLVGGVWYLLLSLLSFQMMPYRPAQQALGECIREVAKFLRIKASFYQPQTDLEGEYKRLVTQQMVVSEKQDAVRELLFKSRQIVSESTDAGRGLVMTFVDLVDLYEQITAIHYDYTTIREKFGPTGILQEVSEVIEMLANELDNIGFAIQANLRHTNLVDLTQKLEGLKNRMDAVAGQEAGESTLVLKKIYVNLRTIAQRLADILSYANAKGVQHPSKVREQEFGLFVTKQKLDLGIFLNNLTLNSSIFRFSVRVAVVAVFAYTLTKLVPYGQHSYWVLLTVVFILKPAFSLTKQRNYQRVIGTLIGGIIGLAVLYLVKNDTALFFILLVFMTGFYSVQRLNYVLSVVLMTPFMLILFKFLGGGGFALLEERVVDTLVGCGIAFAATYLIFPNWESEQLAKFQVGVLRANLKYLQVLADGLSGKDIPELQYKLARKDVYVHSANLSAAFQRMVGEPKSKQLNSKRVYEFVVLNHVLSSYIATIASDKRKINAPHSKAFLRPVRRAINSLVEAIRQLDPEFTYPEQETTLQETAAPVALSKDDQLLAEQLEFIRKLCADILKQNPTKGIPLNPQ
ncbi:membrane protein [Rufibacter radiotolerans]|uniref:Membrane protein n=1 Tax=Rufibacter radiotolerans TaxID=1379910 RepID=A0A0H4VH62_9BACT|nr:FUSC family membrane protein [Rufibacter radiotolerans]AKQ45020.1 membrane protein [Rufibacter radiotolerans]